MKNKEKLLTIFTPTYNRGYILPQLYQSLIRQTDHNFIWMIVDDGSSDNTQQFVEEWKKENIVDIVYIHQTNQGKMQAHNVGVQNTTTELFVCVDSDDYLVVTAVETIIAKWLLLTKNEKEIISGLVAYRGKNERAVIGNEFPEGIEFSPLSNLYQKGFVGDTTLIFKTVILRAHMFPKIEGEKFITEAFVYDQIDRKYSLCLIREVLTVCEYREDGLTKNGMKLVIQNPGGWAAYSIQKGNYTKKFSKSFKNYAWAVSYRLMARRKKLPVRVERKLIYVLSAPLGLLLYIRRKLKYRGKKHAP